MKRKELIRKTEQWIKDYHDNEEHSIDLMRSLKDEGIELLSELLPLAKVNAKLNSLVSEYRTLIDNEDVIPDDMTREEKMKEIDKAIIH